ncbi:MAG: LacI family transcriptional regulator [Myxococcales bacterium]|nr:LacI family transcriptional regulator [Myxococcales bacterium]
MPPRAPEMKATLHDVAARAGVSIATVSRALNGLPVSPASRERVERAAQEVGYVANRAARALRSDRSHTMGLIFFDLRSTLGIDLLDSLGEAIEDAGYSLLVSSARGDARRFELLMHRLLERRVDALCCVQARGQSATLERCRSAGIPVVAALTGSGAFAQLPLVAPTTGEAAAALSMQLGQLGHRRVALVADSARTAQLSPVGCALSAQAIEVECFAIPEVGGMEGLLAALLGSPERPTAVVVPGPQTQALLTACQARGLRVPRDLSVVALGPIADTGMPAQRELSVLHIDPQRLGRAAGAAMLGWLAGVRPANRIGVEIGSFVAGATTGPAPGH